MKFAIVMFATIFTFIGSTLSSTTALAASPHTGAFGFNATASGFPHGVVTLTGGGTYDLATGFVRASGGFSCNDAVAQGPLTGCQTGQGVRWDTAELLSSTLFKCTLTDTLKPATTSDHTVVLKADFYRAGDANDESFTAQMIVSDEDLAPLIPGIQNFWIQGVGCGTGVVNFR
jgi:hypothetical protein